MNSRRNIIIGLIILVVIVAFPIWYTLAVGESGPPPELELPVGESACVEAREFMNAHHMKLLNTWRDDVVRAGKKTYTSEASGKTYDMSLTRTCMGCHTNKATFCDRCHTYANVQPYCWDCHIEPEGG